ncbi:MAG: 23S rRNA (adenine(2503)-C(2))-methyltransferase RlmN [Chitinophagales bacterium]|nr:23S rRNA (adenine(2503)-C(2))-methyltransferase RlmN [Chitinophagales bacterium]
MLQNSSIFVVRMQDIRKISKDEIAVFCENSGEPKYRARQIYEWLWEKSAVSFDEMSNLPAAFRSVLAEEYSILPITTDLEQFSDDGTIKLRFKLHDEKMIEGVLIPADNRFTACVSSQVGCTLQCAFCATGLLKRERNLDAGEIYDQVVLLNKYCTEKYSRPLTNIVYMGMGEPLLNIDSVLESIDKITLSGLGMSPKRITVSTVGIARGISKLAERNVKFNLALSLHAATDEKRVKIMPINKGNNIDALVESLLQFYRATANKITFEYILFKDFNDQKEDANALIEICKKVPSFVNLIEYNKVEGLNFEKSTPEIRQRFVSYLENAGVTTKVRLSRGKDINAACGQLANKN